MSAAGKLFCIAPVIALMVIAGVIGCSPDRTGTASGNKPPIVYIVNTPPDGAQFSRNPDLNWYATDIDGFISMFRYTVIVDSLMTINGTPVTVEEFIAQATPEQFGWKTLTVDLDNPQSTATVRLYADVDDPVNSYVEQYLFVQAMDDQGALSEVAWRRYSRNNHYPNTHHRASQVFINAKSENSPSPGIVLTWDGADSTDWGRAIPPLEYEWRLFGPFEQDDPIYVNLVKEGCVYDPVGDSLTNCRDVPVLDLTTIPTTLMGITQPIAHSEGPNYATDPTDVWVTDESVTIYDVFKDVPNITKTTQFKFVFWVRARDDGFVPDPTPSFSQFYVIEALFEKNVALYDDTFYNFPAAMFFPDSLDLTKSVFYNYINTALENIYGPGTARFDTITPTDPSVPPGTSTDYYFVTTSTAHISSPVNTYGGKAITPISPTMVDILSHKVHLFYNDDALGGPSEDTAFGLLGYTYFAMDMGASAWFMARNMENGSQSTNPGPFAMSALFSSYYGIELMEYEGWTKYSLGTVIDGNPLTSPTWNEQFIGAKTLIPSIFPDIDIDPELLKRYVTLDENWFLPLFADQFGQTPVEHELLALPEVGTGTRTSIAPPVYLYSSKDSSASPYDGKVMGVAQEANDVRSVAFLFTPIATRADQTQVLFNNTLAYLMDKFIHPDSSPKASSMHSTFASWMSLENRRKRVSQFLDQLEEQGESNPEVFKRLGLKMAPPVIVPATAHH